MTDKEAHRPPHPPSDRLRDGTDRVAFYLERVQALLVWVDEHCCSFERLRLSSPNEAESEFNNLKDAAEQAVLYAARLTESLLEGKSIDPATKMPPDLCNVVWHRLVKVLREKHRGEADLGGW